jgi:phage tail sheath gpL-like
MSVDPNAVARVVGIDTSFINLLGSSAIMLPQRVALVGQGATAATYALTPLIVRTAVEVGLAYGFGSPLHIAAAQLLPLHGDGIGRIPCTVYPMVDDGGAVVAAGDITPVGTHSGSASYRVVVNGIKSAAFVLSDGDVVADVCAAVTAAMAANVSLPVTATDSVTTVDVEAKWKGESGNDILLSVEGPVDQGITFGFTQPINGATNPDVDDALSVIGVDVWETLIVNCLEVTDATTLDKIQAWGDTRWGALVKKPAMAICGSTEATAATMIALGEGRKDDRVNGVINAIGSSDLPCAIAARAVARIAVVANGNPPHDYGGLKLTGLLPGTDAQQASYATRDALVHAGIGTTTVEDGTVLMSDTVLFYHPDGEVPPAFRYVCDVVKLQNLIFNLDLIFNAPEWDGAPLIPDDQPTTNSTARKPSSAISAVNSLIDAFALLAILSDPEGTKPLTTASIDGANPKRLNISLTVKLSGNANVISIDFNFGFYFGVQAIGS